jgi:hypothetical protein
VSDWKLWAPQKLSDRIGDATPEDIIELQAYVAVLLINPKLVQKLRGEQSNERDIRVALLMAESGHGFTITFELLERVPPLNLNFVKILAVVQHTK